MQSVLFVDDENFNFSLYEMEFKDEPYKLFWAKDGVVAQEILTKERIDLVVTDVKMPNMNGILLIANMLQNQPRIPVIVVSAHDYFREWLSLDGINVKAFFVKPFSVKLLKFAVADILNKPQ